MGVKTQSKKRKQQDIMGAKKSRMFYGPGFPYAAPPLFPAYPAAPAFAAPAVFPSMMPSVVPSVLPHAHAHAHAHAAPHVHAPPHSVPHAPVHAHTHASRVHVPTYVESPTVVEIPKIVEVPKYIEVPKVEEVKPEPLPTYEFPAAPVAFPEVCTGYTFESCAPVSAVCGAYTAACAPTVCAAPSFSLESFAAPACDFSALSCASALPVATEVPSPTRPH
eukprot:NODE_749_length_1203_cov_2747.672444_g602_i0.p2 GENE.NODE_749_length_1203_cov_2747.672444_g602_i0~~NODE_749_length_1203_cov_2747.672444_g602_i0.p2  ORF type:complete len:220 (-),score=64.87 NODE_749_length_1203_cov_2747.672444_g602_i0:511-1170(-)